MASSRDKGRLLGLGIVSSSCREVVWTVGKDAGLGSSSVDEQSLRLERNAELRLYDELISSDVLIGFGTVVSSIGKDPGIGNNFPERNCSWEESGVARLHEEMFSGALTWWEIASAGSGSSIGVDLDV